MRVWEALRVLNGPCLFLISDRHSAVQELKFEHILIIMHLFQNLARITLVIVFGCVKFAFGLPVSSGVMSELGNHLVSPAPPTMIRSTPDPMDTAHVPSLVQLDTAMVQMRQKNEYALQLRKFSKPYGEKLNQEGGNPRRELRKFRYTGCGACGDSSWNTPKVATLFPWFLYTAYQIIFRGRMYWVIRWPYGGTLFINFTQSCICHIFAPIDERGRAKGVKEMEGHRGY